MTDWNRIKQIFADLSERPPGERAEALARLRADDPAAHGEVRSLLDAHEAEQAEEGGVGGTSGPTLSLEAAAAAIDHKPGEMIGRYRLLERIGEGGFGVVFVAEQTEPIRRRVAIKIVKLGMDTQAVVARFEAERQALAIMEHPGIARVIDAGATATGRPYFVMELVKGRPIGEYCDEAKLSIAQRLELFVAVCRAVQHAHQKGIIHRDLKPGNVLVTLSDGRPAPKVIDFGIAKAASGGLTPVSAYTQFFQLLGTPDYMSPEQAAGAMDLDTRTDVYSLGVVLYEILTGATPFGGDRLRSASFDEMRRIIREDQPPAPSTRVTTNNGARLVELADRRGMEPGRLAGALRRELDWIVMRALDKAPSRRYDSAEAFAADIERYLRGEPVLAGPPTTSYRLRKFVSRRRGLVAGAALMVLAMGVGVTGLGAGFLKASTERDRAVAATALAEKAREAAALDARKYKSASEFLSSMLSSAGPEGRTGRDVTVREVLDLGAAAVDNGSLRDQPDVEATARLAIGSSYVTIGQPLKAERHLKLALQLRERVSGPTHPGAAECLIELAALALNQHRVPEAEALATRAVALFRAAGPDHPSLCRAMRELGGIQAANGRLDEARATLSEAIALADRLFGPHSKDAAELRSYTAINTHDPEGSATLMIEALEGFQAAYGPKHPETTRTLSQLGAQYHMQRRYDDAERCYSESLAITSETIGPASPASINNQYMLAWLAESRRDFPTAEARWARVVELSTQTFGAVSGPVVGALNRRGVALQKAGDDASAERVFRECLSIYDPPRGLAPDSTLSAVLLNVAPYAQLRGDGDEVERLTRRVLDLPPSVNPDSSWTRPHARNMLGEALGKRGLFSEAERMLLESYEALCGHSNTKDRDYPYHAARRLEQLYVDWDRVQPDPDRVEQAARWRARGDEHAERMRAKGFPFRPREVQHQ